MNASYKILGHGSFLEENFLGIGKRAAENRQRRKDTKDDKKQAKVAKKLAKADLKTAKADKKRATGEAKTIKALGEQELNKQGVQTTTKLDVLKELGGKALDTTSSIFNFKKGAGEGMLDSLGSGSDGSGVQDPNKNADGSKKVNWLLWGGIALGVVILIIVLIVVFKKKK